MCGWRLDQIDRCRCEAKASRLPRRCCDYRGFRRFGMAARVMVAAREALQLEGGSRDVLTHVRGAHVLKVGYEGWFGDDVEPFQGPWSHPGFSFDNLLKLLSKVKISMREVSGTIATGHRPERARYAGQNPAAITPGNDTAQAQPLLLPVPVPQRARNMIR